MRVIRQLIEHLNFRGHLRADQIEQLEDMGLIEVPETDGEMPLDDLELTVRGYNCLRREGIHTVSELIQLSESDLLDIRNMAPAIEDVKAKLAIHGLALRDDLLPGESWSDEVHDAADGWDAHGDNLVEDPPRDFDGRDKAKNPHLRREVQAARILRKDRHDPHNQRPQIRQRWRRRNR